MYECMGRWGDLENNLKNFGKYCKKRSKFFEKVHGFLMESV